nr:MAG TPA: hypothetical protein [Caudoviricetes sp.]
MESLMKSKKKNEGLNMRHLTALPFLDAFLKPTKHILLAYSFIIVYVNSAKKERSM